MNRITNTLAVALMFLAGGLVSSQIARAHLTTVADIPILTADGIGPSHFGQGRTAVTTRLERIYLREPARQALTTDCGVDSQASWPGLDVYFFRDRFVGYKVSDDSSLATVKGLVVGDGVRRAAELYPGSFHVTEAQGGAWSATTANGGIGGFLSSPRIHAPSTEITSIEAGHLGCAAAQY